MSEKAVLEWLLAADEPWTRYRALIDLVGLTEDRAEVLEARKAMVEHLHARVLVETAATWPGNRPLTRHNDAAHPLYALSTLADFGFQADDAGVVTAVDRVLEHQAPEGPFETKIKLYKRFGGKEGNFWTWMNCDAPTLLYALLAFGLRADPRVGRALEHLVDQVEANGWRCAAAPELGGFRGPGRLTDPCPIANVYSLKALAQVPALVDSDASRRGVEMLLDHWEQRGQRKLYLFGIGTRFGKLKYPFVWYDILHVTDTLSRFPFARSDQRYQEMVAAITAQASKTGQYTATSMYRAWKGWSFADKKRPSPWLTFLVARIQRRSAPN